MHILQLHVNNGLFLCAVHKDVAIVPGFKNSLYEGSSGLDQKPRFSALVSEGEFYCPFYTEYSVYFLPGPSILQSYKFYCTQMYAKPNIRKRRYPLQNH